MNNGMRLMLYDVLRHRFAAWLAVLLQTLLFLSVPLAVIQLQVLFGLAPGNIINISYIYIILILCCGICLQLLRLWTRSLWTAIGFHLGYLEITRFVVMADAYGAPPIITYYDSVLGLGGVFISLGMVVVGGIIVSLIILGAKRFIRSRASSFL